MTIGEILKCKDIDTYNKLIRLCKFKRDKKEIKLGDSPENLMKQRYYKRIGRRVRQYG